MQPSAEQPQNENTYVLDSEHAAEMARLLDQDIIVTQNMGGLLQQRPDFAGIHRVLDVACGPGGWIQEAAFAHPDIELVGIDISNMMIEYARSQVKLQGLENATFRVMNAMKPLDFPDNSFDLVNARALGGFMLSDAWYKLLNECFRITRLGGFIRLTESDDLGVTTSPALEEINRLFNQTKQIAGRSFLPPQSGSSVVSRLGRLLRQAGYQKIEKTPIIVDYSAGEAAHEAMYNNWRVALKLLQPFLVGLKLITQERADELYEQVLEQMADDDFGAISYGISFWGEKPH